MKDMDRCTGCCYQPNRADSYPCRDCKRSYDPEAQATMYGLADDKYVRSYPVKEIKEAPDMVNHPSHYEASCSLECIEAMRIALGSDGVLQFCLGNAFKYLWRHKYKNGLEDLHKAEWYCNYVKQLPASLISEELWDRAAVVLQELCTAIKEALEKWEEAHKE